MGGPLDTCLWIAAPILNDTYILSSIQDKPVLANWHPNINEAQASCACLRVGHDDQETAPNLLGIVVGRRLLLNPSNPIESD